MVTTRSKPSGRGLKISGSPIKEWALANQYPVAEWAAEPLDSLFEKVKQMHPDLFIVTSFGVILKKDWLDIPRLAPINLHASILPKYRGASPMQMSLLNGDPETGVSVMRMIPKCDAGDVLLIRKTPISLDDTTPSLEKKLSHLASEALLEALEKLSQGNVAWERQDEGLATICSKIEKSQGRLDWKKSSIQLDREIRAYRGWPGSYFYYQNKRIHVGRALVSEIKSHAHQAGKIVDVSSTAGVAVACGEGSLLIQELQLEGRKMLPAADFLRGFSFKAGDFLE